MGINPVGFSNLWAYAKRGMKLYPDFVLGTGNEVFTSSLRNSFYGIKNASGKKVGGQHFRGFGSQLQSAIKKVETHNSTLVKQEGGFWRSNWKAIRTTPGVVKKGWQDAGKAVAKAGKTGAGAFKSQLWGGLKGLSKRLPLIGSLMIVGCELPNIFSAIKEKGLLQGLKETGKAGARVGAGMAGMAIGQALIPIPFVGGLIGYMAGDWLASKVVGKSYSEKKMEAEELAQQQQTALLQEQAGQQVGTPQQGGYTPNMFAQSGNSRLNDVPFSPQMMPQLGRNDLMQLQQQLYGPMGAASNSMDQDFMLMSSGLNRLG